MWKKLEILRNEYLDLNLDQVIDYEKFSMISIIYNLVNIHPFGDGNGRTSRLMMNYVQMYHNEPFVKVFTEDRVEYIDSLNLTEDKGDISIFRDFICGQQIKFYKSEIEKHKKQGKGFSLLF